MNYGGPLMSTRNEMNFSADEMLSADHAGAPIDVWTLDELDQYADLDSVRLAWTHTDGPGA
jgi:hypothetical protein